MIHSEKVVIITGAAQGLGLACAERFHADGAKVVLVDIQIERLKFEAERLGERATWWAGDLADITQVIASEIVDKAVSQFDRLDIVINNAGITQQAEFLEFPEADFDRVLRVNLKAPFLIGQAAAKVMIKQGRGGVIINMSSINAILAHPTAVAYGVSKGGIKQLTAAMALALIPYGIRVNAIGPGTILTELVKNTVMANDARRRAVLSRTPIGRCGEPSEVASVASFLASDDASYIVGQTIYPDGGRLILNSTVPVND